MNAVGRTEPPAEAVRLGEAVCVGTTSGGISISVSGFAAGGPPSLQGYSVHGFLPEPLFRVEHLPLLTWRNFDLPECESKGP